ncbi:phosphate:Na+ symporter [Natronocella acetinitrilica]|uniref:Phosphate:Na+ symporter n=1 Tax=Natronocella acetinitrilica TaxID=414046 RepID=A0AAE3G7G7_9GAMM|nr:phosphate:Na+ symporter [Natronocella acetinitrilica]
MTLGDIGAFLGGIGLFLLGMKLMTDGLKVAAGGVLRRILLAATSSPLRGLGSGVLITAMVQSSSAVIFATIGFVNAGVLSLSQSVGVIYGANLGTTLTSWVVALVGFNIDLQAMALPVIAVGMALRITGGGSRRGALGEALAGFGIFFLGIDVLRDIFAGTELALFDRADGALRIPAYVLIGGVMTVLMQSSSAALAVTLTAAAGGLLPVDMAAAMIIGANVGTTSTAAFAVIGATAAARRAALAHVLFNVVTAVAALAALPLLLPLVHWIAAQLGPAGGVAATLALFHTATKLLGLCLMLPFTPRLIHFLEGCFRGQESSASRPRYLDKNVLAAPSLALDALSLELHRIRGATGDMLRAVLSTSAVDVTRLQRAREDAEELALAIGDFCRDLGGRSADPVVSDALSAALRVVQYRLDIADRALELARLKLLDDLPPGDLRDQVDALTTGAADIVDAADAPIDEVETTLLTDASAGFESRYADLKNRLLRAVGAGQLPPRALVTALDRLSALRRVVDQAVKASIHLRRVVATGSDSTPSPVETSVL